ncbi:hypothetical protein GRI72_12965 [Altererythrobacter marinus]|uniref:LysR family transcriptional regulator n=1 Tax=Pelagerythrobacter marinus TaxID=538382 RepID=A0ABW9UY23_9SPHN|nr:hypothetical protein [Pelagerythrobacter marinus]MXO69731.1 hypothetical protein [Pelagerythrobacter marinus]
MSTRPDPSAFAAGAASAPDRGDSSSASPAGARPRGADDASGAGETGRSGRATRHDGWSLDKQVAFLRALSATHSVSAAARSVGMSRQSAYRLRSRLKGKAFDLAWEVAFHHSYDVLAHAALERALNGVEMPVYYQGEQVGSYRRYDERLTVALLNRFTLGGNPVFGRLGPRAELHARDFEALLARIGAGEAVDTGAPGPGDPGELETILRQSSAKATFRPAAPCPSAPGDEEIIAALQALAEETEK